MAPLGEREGFVKGFGAEGSATECATGGFIRFPFCSLMGNFGEGKIRISTHTGVPLQRPKLPKWDKFAVSGCKLGSGLCADVAEGRICLISTNTICGPGSDERSVLETTHFAYIRTSGIAKICSAYLVFSNNYWWVANICYFSPEQ